MHNPEIIKQVVGMKCWRAWAGLLPAIFFELGEKKDSKTGEFSLCLDTSPWQIFADKKELVNSKDKQEIIDKVLAQFVGKKCTRLKIDKKESQITILFDELKVVVYLNENTDTFYLIGPNNQQVVIAKKTLR